ncbi:MAG: hypothetical protein J5744_01190, partial [Oscillospiraceae bacterium]|nr:hypothetical protein [Oscillospiraceae bacterium]
ADLGSNCYLVTTGSDIGPSNLTLSEDGSRVFSVCTDMTDSTVSAVVISLSDGSVTPLEQDINDLSSVCISDGRLLYSGKDSLHVFSDDGEHIFDIPFTGDNAVSFSAHGGKVYCVFPDSTVAVYSGETAERRITLGSDTSSYTSGKAFRYIFTDSRLYLFCDHDLNVISLDSDSTTPLYSVSGSVMDADPQQDLLICYGNSDGPADYNYHLASFREYSVEELTERCREQLDSFLLSP